MRAVARPGGEILAKLAATDPSRDVGIVRGHLHLLQLSAALLQGLPESFGLELVILYSSNGWAMPFNLFNSSSISF